MTQSAPLILTPSVIAALEDLRERAASHPVSMMGLAERLGRPVEKLKHMAQMSEQSIHIAGPIIYSVTFSLETDHPCGTARHMSMSVDREGWLPSSHAVWMVAEYLGFVGGLSSCFLHREELQGHGMAITVIQPVATSEGGRA